MPPQPIFSNRLRHGSKPASPAAEQQALNAGSPEVVSGQGAPIAQGLSSDLNIAQKSESRSDRDPLTARQKLALNVVQKTADKFRAEYAGAAALDIRVVHSRDEIPVRYH